MKEITQIDYFSKYLKFSNCWVLGQHFITFQIIVAFFVSFIFKDAIVFYGNFYFHIWRVQYIFLRNPEKKRFLWRYFLWKLLIHVTFRSKTKHNEKLKKFTIHEFATALRSESHIIPLHSSINFKSLLENLQYFANGIL